MCHIHRLYGHISLQQHWKFLESRVAERDLVVPAESFPLHHQLVTKDGDLLSAHGYTHFSASYLSRTGNFLNKLTASVNNHFLDRSTSDAT